MASSTHVSQSTQSLFKGLGYYFFKELIWLFISRNSQNISLFLLMGFSHTLLFSGDRTSLFALKWILRSITVKAYLARWCFFFLGFFKIRPVQRRKTSCISKLKVFLTTCRVSSRAPHWDIWPPLSLRPSSLAVKISLWIKPSCHNHLNDSDFSSLFAVAVFSQGTVGVNSSLHEIQHCYSRGQNNYKE